MTEEEIIENAAIEHQKEFDWETRELCQNSTDPADAYYTAQYDQSKKSFITGAKWALSHQWISVKDRLPENDDNVIIHCRGDYVRIYWYCEKANFFVKAWDNGNSSDNIDVESVDYWMPIPKRNEEKK